MMATVRHVTSSSGLRKFQTDGVLFIGVYNGIYMVKVTVARGLRNTVQLI